MLSDIRDISVCGQDELYHTAPHITGRGMCNGKTKPNKIEDFKRKWSEERWIKERLIR